VTLKRPCCGAQERRGWLGMEVSGGGLGELALALLRLRLDPAACALTLDLEVRRRSPA
jgi:hypothetical protein